MSNKYEDLSYIGGIDKTSSPISYQHKITPTIFAREPIFGMGNRL